MPRKKKSRRKLIRYIDNKIGDVGRDAKIDILNTVSINCGRNIIFEEGTGTRILFQHIDEKILNEIKNRICEDLDLHKIDFSDLTDEEIN